MFKKILFLIFIFQFGFSQERQLIKGKVIYRNIDVPSANVVNNTSQNTTITNENGEFEILARVNDEIIFSSVQYIIRTVRVSEDIVKNKRLIVQINQRVRELDEVVITPDDTEKFLDLKEEQFKGFDYIADKSTRIQNVLTDDRQVVNGLNFVNIFKLLSTLVDSKSEEEKLNISPSEVLPYILDDNFFSDILNLEPFETSDFLYKLDSDQKLKNLILEKNQFNEISKNSSDVSIGYFFSHVTYYLGLKAGEHEFKVMGMAPYANKLRSDLIKKELEKLIWLNSDGHFSSTTQSANLCMN